MDYRVHALLDFIKQQDTIGDKGVLAQKVQDRFALTRDRSVYYSQHYAIRFNTSSSGAFSNTVISLSSLQKYDTVPFIVCVVTPYKNLLYLANTTFLSRVSHSSQDLRVNNIRGSINGSDIMKEFNGLQNSPENFEDLFNIHAEISFEENLMRLVEATNNISPAGQKYVVESKQQAIIQLAPVRALQFVESADYQRLKADLDERVEAFGDTILVASFIENTNIRGRLIEYLIAGEDDALRQELADAIHSKREQLPSVRTTNDLADYTRLFDLFSTATDVKTKIMALNSNPKAYNIDKLLTFLSHETTVFMLYFVGIQPDNKLSKALISVFQRDLLQSTIVLKHWAGRNSRGVTQFEGKTLNQLIANPNNHIDLALSKQFLTRLISL